LAGYMGLFKQIKVLITIYEYDKDVALFCSTGRNIFFKSRIFKI